VFSHERCREKDGDVEFLGTGQETSSSIAFVTLLNDSEEPIRSHPMNGRSLKTWIACILVVFLSAGSLWQTRAYLEEKLASTETLGGIDRYATFLSTDKPVYRVGETIYFRGVILHHASRQPLPTEKRANAYFEIVGPKGDVIAGGLQSSVDSVAGFSWTIPEGQAGGEYKIRVSYPMEGYATAERKFDIRAYRAPRLKSQIKFLRDGYGPGDEVVAMLQVERAEGGIPSDAVVTVTGRVDGAEVARSQTKVDASGQAIARFALPAEIRRGEGTLAMAIEDGGVVETASKTIPILLQTIDLTMYPEGGELIAGLPNRVYLEAFTPAQKPADLAGHVVDNKGKRVAEFRTEHEGRGRFEFTPTADNSYELHIDQPTGIKTTYKLPAIQSQGAVLRTAKNRFKRSEPIELMIGATQQAAFVTLSKKEVEVSRRTLDQLDATKLSLVQLTPPKSADGVLVATVWDIDGKPLAERLLFRDPEESLSIEVIPSTKQVTPGSKANVKIVTKDHSGKPISALVGIAVTDESVLEMIDRREQRPMLPTQVLLESEVKDLADAHVYFDSKSELSDVAVDLLLGTQGWRRFAFVRPTEFMNTHGLLANRVLSYRLPQTAQFEFAMRFEDRERKADFGDRKKAKDGPVDRLAPASKVMAPFFRNEVVLAERQDLAKSRRGSLKAEEAIAKEALFDAIGGAGMGLREKGGPGGGMGGGFGRNDFQFVRIYAHQVRTGRKPNERVDFAETLYWSAGIKTNESGEAEIDFGLSDSVTSFRISAEAFGSTGALGQKSATINSVVPFSMVIGSSFPSPRSMRPRMYSATCHSPLVGRTATFH
jgi:alpha-2-macroglobulin-like protein